MHQTEQQAASVEASGEASEASGEASGDVGAASFFYLRSKQSPHYKLTLPQLQPQPQDYPSTILNYFLNTSIYKYSKLKPSSKLQKESSYITIAM